MSVFEPNATIRFLIPNGDSEIDWSGNVSAPTEPIDLQVFMQRSKQPRADADQEGGVVGRVGVEAFCVIPNRLPTYPDGSQIISPGTVGALEWNGTTYDFELSTSTPAAFSVVDEVLGQLIYGTLLQRTVWGNAVGL